MKAREMCVCVRVCVCKLAEKEKQGDKGKRFNLPKKHYHPLRK